ncbi:MAG: PKD domain-containing protein [Candidatus Bipolaricaulia bacterium]
MKRSMRWAGLVAMIGISLLMLGGCKLFNAPPVANFSWTPSDPIARTDIQFTDDSTDEGGLFGGGGVTAWQWDFGDSGSSAAQNPQHRYTKGGTYTVRLTVTDASGEQSSKTKTIVVNPSLN